MPRSGVRSALFAVVAAGLMLVGNPAATPPLAAQKTSPGDAIFGLTKLHRIRISISAAEWAVLQTSGGRGTGTTGGSDFQGPDGRLIHVGGGGMGSLFPWVRADVRFNPKDPRDPRTPSADFREVGLRYKGNSSFSRSSAAAPLLANFKLKIDHHGTRGSWDGEKTFNLHPGVIDTSKMKDAVAFSLFRAAGVPAPRTAFAEITFTVPGVYNDMSAGLFTIIEDVNKTFLERALPLGGGLLMKPEGLRGGMQSLGDTWASYVTRLRPARDATIHEQQRVIAFGQLISQPDAALFHSTIASFLDVDQFLRFVAINALIVNTDSYIASGHNFYIYLDPKDDKFRFIPWDQDLSMGRGGLGGVFVANNAGAEVRLRFVDADGRVVVGAPPPGMRPDGPTMDVRRPFGGDQRLIKLLLDDPAVNDQYRAILRELAASVFTAAELTRLVDTLEKVGTGRGPSPREFLQTRAAYLQEIVASWGVK